TFDKRSKLYALALQPGQSFPFTPKDELTPSDTKTEAKADAKTEVKSETKPASKPAIVWAGLAERLFEVPLPDANYSKLRVDGKRLWWLESEASSSPERKSSLKTVSIDRLGSTSETVASDVREFELSADGKKLMLMRSPMPA
ncbi:S41 family peptidase, partial [Roseateles sp. GG27B]